jgi:S-adenosylmethionine synthetase
MNYKYFTSESVCAGHPDKVCDQVSDACLDACYKQDPLSRVAIENLATQNFFAMGGEVTTKAKVDFEKIARKTIKRLGYTDPSWNFHYQKTPVAVKIGKQSPDIAQGVDTGGAGDQGGMFGYACKETKQLMPAPIIIAHRLVEKIDEVREKKVISYLRPDGKSQVKVRYEKGKPVGVEGVVLAVPHQPQVTNEQIKKDLYKKVVRPVLESFRFKISKKDLIVNGTGRWEIGGPATDTGETGRKIIVDTYGGMGRHGGGCFSGKDLTKVDRSGAYACRFLAKNIVAAGLADRVEVKVAYVIGQPKPLDRGIETFGTEKKPRRQIEDFAWKLLDLSVPAILETLDLRKPIYEKTAAYGHFGRDGFPWEKIVV